MGDRCEIEVHCNQSDLQTVKDIFKQPEGNLEHTDKALFDFGSGPTTSIFFNEINWGGINEAGVMEAAGIPFVMENGPGDDYDAGVCVFIPGEMEKSDEFEGSIERPMVSSREKANSPARVLIAIMESKLIKPPV